MTNHSVVYTRPEKKATRDGFGEGMLELGKKNKKVVALCADLAESTRLAEFRQKFPERFIELGVAEQNLASIAAGMALMEKIPFIASFAVFNPGRNWEQIRTTICYNDAPVKIIGSHAGIATGEDGATHQGTEDIALMRSLPNMTVIVPCDAIEARKATIAAASRKGPVYIRVARNRTPLLTAEHSRFEIGKADIIKEGRDVTIISCGPIAFNVLQAAEMLGKDGISAQVINCHTVKPLDTKTLAVAARKTGAFVTVEDHQVNGGLGSAVAEALSEIIPVPIKRIGLKDKFGESGATDELFAKYGMTAADIARGAKEAITLKQMCKGTHPFFAEEGTIAGRLLSELAPDQYFRLWGGETIRTVPELEQALKKMDDATFRHHVNNHKNDFSNWIQDCFGDKILAEELRKRTGREKMIEAIKKRLKEVLK